MLHATAPLSTAEPGVSHPRTPVEYFKNDEAHAVHPAPTSGLLASGTGQGFTVHAHRLSSLWRGLSVDHTGLRMREHRPASSFQKYSAGVWGCKTPTATSANGDCA